MKLDYELLVRLLRAILATRDDEIDCGECLQQLDFFTELELAGKSAGEALPLIQGHLWRCGDCWEEYKALVVAVHAYA